jgi:hypothetical protein
MQLKGMLATITFSLAAGYLAPFLLNLISRKFKLGVEFTFNFYEIVKGGK